MPRTTHNYRLHKASGLGFVELGGRRIYLGKYGTPESMSEYQRVLSEWKATGTAERQKAEDAGDITVNELMLAYLRHADTYYVKNGKPTGTAAFLRIALRPLHHMFGETVAKEFGPLKLQAVRDKMIEAGNARSFINDAVSRMRQMFRWGVAQEMLPVDAYTRLATVRGLAKGRSKAREPEPVAPVPLDEVEAVLPFLSPTLADMVRLQLLTGARPGEICSLRPCYVTLGTDGVWIYRPGEHKTEHHGRERRIFIGPRAQEILRPYLAGSAANYCFCPRDVMKKLGEKRRDGRKTPMTPSHRERARKAKARGGQRYNKDSYRTAIVRACERLALSRRMQAGESRAVAKAYLKANGVPYWTPNQLRHTRATELRARYGLEAAQCILGHSDPKITLVYAEQDSRKAADIMKQIG